MVTATRLRHGEEYRKVKKESWLLDCLLIKDLDPKDPVDFVLRFSLMKKK